MTNFYIMSFIAGAGGGLIVYAVVSFFSSSDEAIKEAKQTFDNVLEMIARDNRETREELLELLHDSKRINKALESKIEEIEFEKQDLIKKINHQHSTIQRLHKKIDKLQS